MKVRDIMTKDVVSVDPNSTVADAARKMKNSNVGTVVVIDKSKNEVQGIVTDRKIVTSVVAEARNPADERIGNIVSKNIVTCRDDNDVHDALKVMGEHKVRRLPVVNDHKELVGVLSISDIARDIRSDMDSFFSELSKSTHGAPGGGPHAPHVK